MLRERLQTCQETYKAEFNLLMDQFGKALSEIEDLKAVLLKQRSLLSIQEVSVLSYANTIEAVGHDVQLRD